MPSPVEGFEYSTSSGFISYSSIKKCLANAKLTTKNKMPKKLDFILGVSTLRHIGIGDCKGVTSFYNQMKRDISSIPGTTPALKFRLSAVKPDLGLHRHKSLQELIINCILSSPLGLPLDNNK